MVSNADELVRSDVGVEPIVDGSAKLVPVGVTSAHRGAEGLQVALVARVPDRLTAHVADVLGGAAHCEHLGCRAVHLEVVDVNKLLLPGALGGAMVELDVIKGHVAIDDRSLPVEHSEDLVSLGDLGLVRSDRNDLAFLQTLLLNPLLALGEILASVAVRELLDSRMSCGACRGHFNFNL